MREREYLCVGQRCVCIIMRICGGVMWYVCVHVMSLCDAVRPAIAQTQYITVTKIAKSDLHNIHHDNIYNVMYRKPEISRIKCIIYIYLQLFESIE